MTVRQTIATARLLLGNIIIIDLEYTTKDTRIQYGNQNRPRLLPAGSLMTITYHGRDQGVGATTMLNPHFVISVNRSTAGADTLRQSTMLLCPFTVLIVATSLANAVLSN